MEFDYDQLLAKSPGKSDEVFHWHQDLAYWPVTDETRTVSFWIAIDNSLVKSRYIVYSRNTSVEESEVSWTSAGTSRIHWQLY